MLAAWSAVVRQYPHFDPLISKTDAEGVATDPKRVAEHKFYPFLKYDDRWTRFAPKGAKGKVKSRPIRFAARLDACVFSYYRTKLSARYEAWLSAAGLEGEVLAYRRIPKKNGGGKSNIEFAKEAFDTVRAYGSCCVVALDISDFFENLDHGVLQRRWAALLDAKLLPADHFQVFKALTRYAYVDVKKAYERLGYFGLKTRPDGSKVEGYLRAKKDIPKQLCDGRTFRSKITGDGADPSIIVVNKTGKGVPQGAPLSDLLANLYMFEFDKAVSDRMESLGGTYMRYSDDILLIAPVNVAEGEKLEEWVRKSIATYAPGLDIKEEKSSLHLVEPDGSDQRVSAILPSGKPNKNLEYLGFKYDGKHILIRDKTMSSLYRKVAANCRAIAHSFAKRYQGKSTAEIMSMANVEKLIQAFGPVRDFETKSDDYRKWTFSTYVKRASKVMGPLGNPISRQTRRLRSVIRQRLEADLLDIVGH
ncbi:reverse transcriptase domain-containing protein [Devosia sp. 63-57]|uniref:reverse transcriptase domain-containing protein n=1 Tax=Devosia sp. 63-57 TaxID=1895751 RepID=UPI002579A0BB|nr:reverse transcriptase domain-containing protein [Devosia sp. 63-57]